MRSNIQAKWNPFLSQEKLRVCILSKCTYAPFFHNACIINTKYMSSHLGRFVNMYKAIMSVQNTNQHNHRIYYIKKSHNEVKFNHGC